MLRLQPRLAEDPPVPSFPGFRAIQPGDPGSSARGRIPDVLHATLTVSMSPAAQTGLKDVVCPRCREAPLVLSSFAPSWSIGELLSQMEP